MGAKLLGLGLPAELGRQGRRARSMRGTRRTWVTRREPNADTEDAGRAGNRSTGRLFTSHARPKQEILSKHIQRGVGR